jgi:ribosomal protein S11
MKFQLSLKKRVSKKLLVNYFFKSFKKSFYLYVTYSKNNWGVRFYSFSGNILIEFSARNLFSSRRERRAKDSFDFMLFFFFKKFFKQFRRWKRLTKGCRVRLFGYKLINKHFIRSISYYLRRTKIPLLSIQDSTPIIFNGCRIRKKKR